MKRMRLVTLLLLVVIIAEGLVLYRASRREAELRSALSLYRNHAEEEILETLEKPMTFAGIYTNPFYTARTPLEDALKMIRSRTRGTWNPGGIPICVDPVGLQEAGKQMDSPVGTAPSKEKLPLRDHLRRILKPMGLTYEVKYGLLMITSEESVDKPRADLSENALYLKYRNVLK